jgi:uncharacterized membrane protein
MHIRSIDGLGDIAQGPHSGLRHPNKRAGRRSRLQSSAKNAFSEMPISRRAKEKSQTTGDNINTRSAIGQHSTNKMHHPTRRISAFMLKPPHDAAKYQ